MLLVVPPVGAAADATTPVAGDWPMWRFDAGRSASGQYSLPEHLELKWVRQYTPREQTWDDPLNNDLMQFDRIFEPVIGGGKMYIGFNDSDRVVALDVATGAEVWSFDTEGPVRFPPVYWQSKVYAVSDDGYLYCIRADDGKLAWRFRGGPSDRKVLGNSRLISMWPARGGPVLQDGTLYFAASIWPFLGTFIYALDAETGRVQWVNDGSSATYIKQPHSAPAFAGLAPQGTLAIGGDKLVIPGGRSVPGVFDRKTGELVYYQLDEGGKGNGGSLVLADSHRFYVHTRQRGVRRFNLETGKKNEFQCNEPVLSHDGLYAATETAVTAMDSDDKVMWQVEADGSGDLIRAGNRLYVAGKERIAAITMPHDQHPAQVAWSVPVDRKVDRLLAGAGHLIAVTVDGRIMSYGAKLAAANSPSGDNVAEKSGDAARPEPLVEQTRTLAPTADAIDQVRQLLSSTDSRQGYALVYHPENVEILEALLQETSLQIVVVDTLASKVDALRKQLRETGLYGKRISVHRENPLRFQAPPYIAKIVWIGASAGNLTDPRSIQTLLSSVRPYGGVARLPKISSLSVDSITESLKRSATSVGTIEFDMASQFSCVQNDQQFVLTRTGALPGAAAWTHLYGNIANTVKSDDQLVKLPLGILWFGGASNLDVLPRHGHGPPEQVVGGRLFIQGMNSLSARDVYTGQLLWKREFDDLGTFDIYFDKSYKDTPLDTAYNQKHIPGANVRGTNYVVTPEFVYLVNGAKCMLIDSLTGETKHEFELPTMESGRKPTEWAYLGIYNDVLLAGAGFGRYTERLNAGEEEQVEKDGTAWTSDRFGSQGLIAMNRHTGEKLWEVEANHSFLHNAIIAGDDQVYLLDRLPATVEDRLKRRGLDPPSTYRLIALDARTGNLRWENKEHIVGTWLGYSAEHKILLQANAAATDRSQDEAEKGMVAYHAEDGSIIWSDFESKYSGPCILYHDKIITNSKSYKVTSGVLSLLDGKPVLIDNPLTGDEEPWTYQRAYGCNTAIASENLLTFRSGAAGFYDLNARCGTGNFGGFRSGCSSNLIAADGVLNAPDYTRTCSCGYQNQTSLALVHMPDLEVWSVGGFGYLEPGDPVRRLGINLAAAGDRRAEDGTVWLEFPFVSGDPAPLDIRYTGDEPATFRHHASAFQAGVLPWVAASGVRNIESITIGLVATDPEKKKSGTEPANLPEHYTVRLYFAEPDDAAYGQRVFDVVINGQTVLSDFDVAAAAEVSRRGIVREFRGVKANGSLRVEFEKSHRAELGAVLSGLEIIAED
jgi:outer membrane protein assembly factor BamB